MLRPDSAVQSSGAGCLGQSKPSPNSPSAERALRANQQALISCGSYSQSSRRGPVIWFGPFGPSGGEFLTARMHSCTARARKLYGIAFIYSALMMLQSPMALLPAVALNIGLCAEHHVDRSASNEGILPAITIKNSGSFPEHGRSPGQRI